MKIFYYLYLGICLSVLHLTDTSVAEGNESTVHNLDEVVVTATKTAKKLENVPAVVTIINQEQIESMPARTVGDLLADLPGFIANEPEGAGMVTPQTITIRGNGFTGHTLILLNGQRMNSPSNDYAFLTFLPVRAVERIEIIRGPFSALYGSSGGGGVINVITKDGGEKSYVQPFGIVGDFGRYDYGFDAGGVWKNCSLGIFYDHKNVDNYYLYDDKGVNVENREHDHDRFHVNLSGTLAENFNFSLSGGMDEGTTNYGISDTLGLENSNEYSQPYVNFRADGYITDKIELKGQAGWLGEAIDYFGETLVNVSYPPSGPQIPILDYDSSVNNTQSNRYHIDMTLNYYYSPQHTLTMGTELIHADYEKSIRHAETGEILDVQGLEGSVTDEDDTLYSFYAQYDALFSDRLELVLGARFDNYDSFGSEISPKGTLRYQYAQGGNIKFSIGKGFRAPNLNQLYSAPWSIDDFIVYQGNPDLEAETMISYEFSVEQYTLDDTLFFRVTPYFTDGENFIAHILQYDPINTNGLVMSPQNVDDVEIKGVDVEFSYQVVTPFTIFVNYNYNETLDKATDEILEGYPENTAALGVRWNYRIHPDWRVFGYFSERYRGQYDKTSWASVPVTETVGDYWSSNASIGLVWKGIVSLKVDGFNLFNDRSKTGVDSYLAERNFLAELSVRYTF